MDTKDFSSTAGASPVDRKVDVPRVTHINIAEIQLLTIKLLDYVAIKVQADACLLR